MKHIPTVSTSFTTMFSEDSGRYFRRWFLQESSWRSTSSLFRLKKSLPSLLFWPILLPLIIINSIYVASKRLTDKWEQLLTFDPQDFLTSAISAGQIHLKCCGIKDYYNGVFNDNIISHIKYIFIRDFSSFFLFWLTLLLSYAQLLHVGVAVVSVSLC